MTLLKKEDICSINEQAFHTLANHSCRNCAFYVNGEDFLIEQSTSIGMCYKDEKICEINCYDVCNKYQECGDRIFVKNSQLGISSRGYGKLK